MSWEYEGLFEDIADLPPMLTSWWQSVPTALKVGRMGYRTKTTVAGPRLEAEVFPIFGREDTGKARAAKKKMTPEKQQRLNRQRGARHLVQLADANFGENDYSLTLTYKGAAPDFDRSRKDMRNFCLKLKRLRKKRGLEELKYIYAIEGETEYSGGWKRERIHIHMITNGGISREEIEEIWGRGYANCDRLQPDENGLEALALYIYKEQRGRRRICCSRNLKQPKVRTSDSKFSNRRVREIAADFPAEAKEIMEKKYPGYSFVKCQIHYSDIVSGVYIRCVMRKRDARGGVRPF